MATRDPHFNLHHKAIQGVQQVEKVCFGLESLQCAAAIFALAISVMGPAWTPLMHMYTLILYFFLVVFSHVVFFYIISALEKNIWNAYQEQPLRINDVLPITLRKNRKKVLPVLTLHGLTVFFALLLWAIAPQANQSRQKIAVAAAAASSGVLLIWIRSLLKSNTKLVSSFILTGGRSGIEKDEL